MDNNTQVGFYHTSAFQRDCENKRMGDDINVVLKHGLALQ